MNVPLPQLPGGDAAQFWWMSAASRSWSAFVGRLVDARRSFRAGQTSRWHLSDRGQDHTACPPTSPTRSPPARWSSVRRRSSRSWSRTRSTPARAASPIHVELGGKKQVRVEDDGEGMEPEDARLAIERHATSKIRRADDLAAILTLGFRGEALPSIASVSHFVLRTRARGRDERHRDPRQRRRGRVGHARSAPPRARSSRSTTSSTTCRRAASS